jgi:adenylate cyclase
MDAWKQSGIRFLTMYFAGLVAEARGRLGQIREALATIDGALDELGSTGGRVYGAELYRLKGALILGQLGDAPGGVGSKRGTAKGGDKLQADGEECIRKALDIARHQGAKMWELRAAMSLARLLRTRGEEKEALRELEQIYGWFTEGLSTPDLREARALLGNVPENI